MRRRRRNKKGTICISVQDARSLSRYLDAGARNQLALERVRGVSVSFARQLQASLLGAISQRLHRLRSLTGGRLEAHPPLEDAADEAARIKLLRALQELRALSDKIQRKFQTLDNLKEQERARRRGRDRRRRQAKRREEREAARKASPSATVQEPTNE